MPFVPSAAPAAIAAARRRLLSRFKAEGATSEDAAIAFDSDGPIEQRQFQRMLRAAVFRKAGSGRYWLDDKRAADWSGERRKRGLIFAAIAAGATAIFLTSGR